MKASRFLLAAGALAIGFLLVWLAGAVPAFQGAAPGSALDTGPRGASGLAQELRDRGALATSVRIDDTPEGLGLSPTPWDAWRLRPEDAVLSVRSNVPLQAAELAAARPWLEAGGRLVVVADTVAELVIAEQLVGARLRAQPLRDAAYLGAPQDPVVADGIHRYRLTAPLAVTGGAAVVATSGLSWTTGERVTGPEALGALPVVARFAVGEGAVLVVGDSHPLENGGRGDLDNGRLVERVVAELLAGGGAVYVDEGHRAGGNAVRVDLALRGIGAGGRLTIAALLVLALATALFPWPARLAAALRRRFARRADATPRDALAEVAARHPGWDPRLLARLAARRPDEPPQGPGDAR